MKKIAIVTLNGYINYGNRLQNYALEQTLNDLGCYAVTLKLKNRKPKDGLVYNLFFLFKLKCKNIIRILTMDKYKRLRIKKLKAFSKKHINEINADIDSVDDKFDFFITGSDQVWNTQYIQSGKDSKYFLTFASKHKRIAYAPSFGVSLIPEENQDDYRTWINGIEHLSVREVAGVDIIKRLCNKECDVLCDPVALVSKEHWQSISKSAPNFTDNKYVFTYFLGKVPEYIENIIVSLEKQGYKILRFGQKSDRRCFIMDPTEFLYSIIRADLVLTDSFHGSLLSIIFHIPFTVFDRTTASGGDMSTRIETLLSRYKLENRYYNKMDDYKKEIFTTEFSCVDAILNEEKNRAKVFLTNALSLKDS